MHRELPTKIVLPSSELSPREIKLLIRQRSLSRDRHEIIKFIKTEDSLATEFTYKIQSISPSPPPTQAIPTQSTAVKSRLPLSTLHNVQKGGKESNPGKFVLDYIRHNMMARRKHSEVSKSIRKSKGDAQRAVIRQKRGRGLKGSLLPLYPLERSEDDGSNEIVEVPSLPFPPVKLAPVDPPSELTFHPLSQDTDGGDNTPQFNTRSKNSSQVTSVNKGGQEENIIDLVDYNEVKEVKDPKQLKDSKEIYLLPKNDFTFSKPDTHSTVPSTTDDPKAAVSEGTILSLVSHRVSILSEVFNIPRRRVVLMWIDLEDYRAVVKRLAIELLTLS